MAHTTTYKGHDITVWTREIDKKHWDWEFQAGPLPVRKNSDELAPTEAAAIDEAMTEARRLLDQLP